MIHGFDRHAAPPGPARRRARDVRVGGPAAHASTDPWEGVNALDACVATFNARGDAPPADAARLPHPRHRRGRRRAAEHHPGARGGRLLRARAEPRRDVGALPRAWWRRGGRGAPPPATRLDAFQHPDVYEPLRRNQALNSTSSRRTWRAPGWPRARRAGPHRLLRHRQREPGHADDPRLGRHRAAGDRDPHARVRRRRGRADRAGGLLAGAKLMALSAADLLADPPRLAAMKEEFRRR